MAYAYSELLTQAQGWAETALAEGRLSHEQAQAVFDIDNRSPDTLFTAATAEQRPMIVAFMGGTGVGKSSLLNRLAGQPIARAGVERPTSREVTLYHHQSLSIQKLPAGLPLDSIKISWHNDDENSHIVWIDMPDFDSIERDNQKLVLEWLPHIDVLLYVVSPERYRDNKAWQLLLAEGGKHAWLFVMNQWDRGQAVQYDDFIRQLHKAGFEQPLVFRSSCTEPDGDEFSELLLQLRQLAGQHSVEQIQQRSNAWRLQQLKAILQRWRQDFAGQDFTALNQSFETLWQTSESALLQGLAWPLQQLSQFWAEHPGQQSEIKLWDEWAQNRLDDILDELVLQTGACNIPGKPLKTALHTIRERAAKNIAQQAELAGRQALLKPGNGLQRMLLTLTSIGETLLPIAAMAVVGYQVFSGYYHGAAESGAYLGVDFAIHSILLIGLSWLIPFFLHKKIHPSLQKAAFKGLQKGLQQAMSAISVEIEQLLLAEQQRNSVLQQQLASLIESCVPVAAKPIEKDSLLGRALVAE